LVIVTVLFIATVRIMASIDAPLAPTQPPDLVITGHQWWWEARYPNGATTANEIHIPAGRRLLARIESADVIHDFWVPQLARKMDAVPGRPSYLWLEADTPGLYPGACSEFCGKQHAWMRFQVVAESDAGFSAWVSRQATPTSGEPEGSRIFQQQKCGDCHTVSSTDSRSLIGPPLAHISGRRLLGGEIPNNAANLTRWIVEPQSIKPGNRMPNPRLSSSDSRLLTTYLESLQ
jgi:cytochrome c oxidase subunit 2